MSRVYCLDCDERITFNPHVKLGMRFNCPECGSELEVISVDPLEIDWAYDYSWDEDEDDEDW
jgi:transcription initiation factor IIE alpha subunit